MLAALVRQDKPGRPIGEGFAGAVLECYPDLGAVPEDLQAFARVETGAALFTSDGPGDRGSRSGLK
jgi:hypothetical protein